MFVNIYFCLQTEIPLANIFFPPTDLHVHILENMLSDSHEMSAILLFFKLLYFFPTNLHVHVLENMLSDSHEMSAILHFFLTSAFISYTFVILTIIIKFLKAMCSHNSWDI